MRGLGLRLAPLVYVMDNIYLWIINVLIGLLSFGMGFAIKHLYSRLHNMDQELKSLHTVYAKQVDVKEAVETIRRMVQRIEDKLDRKVDR